MWNPVLWLTRAFGIPDFVTYLLIIIVAIYIYGTWTFGYFKDKGVSGPYPYPVIGNIMTIATFEQDPELVKKHGKTFGCFMGRTPCYVISEPEKIRDVTTKHFANFMNHDKGTFPIHEDLQKGLNAMEGQEWKTLRSLLSPTFTSGKLKRMLPIINEAVQQFDMNVNHIVERNEEIEIRELTGNYAMDVISQCFFGIKMDAGVNAQTSAESNPFAYNAKLFFDSFTAVSPAFLLAVAMPKLSPLFDKIGLPMYHPEAMAFFRNNIFNIVNLRKDMKNPPQDFLQLMIEAHKLDETEEKASDMTIHCDSDGLDAPGDEQKSPKRAMTRQEILGSALIFFMAGYETTATTVGWAIYCMALNPLTQETLHEQIVDVLGDNKSDVTYEDLAKMPYLEQVINETLRLYAVIPRVERLCNESCKIGDLNIEKGNSIHISIWTTHRSEEYWDKPLQFMPERFSAENKQKIVPYSFLPFGLGPRSCIGKRLALLEIKVALVKLCVNYKFTRSENTQVPPKFKMGGTASPADGVKIRAERR